MRIPGWMFILGLLALVSATAVCSVASYTLAREFVIDAEMSGVDVPSFNEFVAAQPTLTRTPLPTNTSPPIATPLPGSPVTAEPTSDTTTDEEDAPQPTEIPAVEAAREPEAEAQAINDPLSDIPQWEDPSRITVLLMGIDQRTATSERGPFRTDTMILVQIDPIRMTAGVLSIPRDLWVDIPGFKSGRITNANYLGDQAELPEGGPGLAMETVYTNIGVEVDYYIRVNFEVFTRVVDTVAPNGVEVCPPEGFTDPKYPDEGYGFIVVTFEAGCQRLNSERLLQYARTRATQGGDFDRNRRQQEVLRGIQDEVLSAGGIVNFITQIPILYNDLAGSYVTNLPLEQILSLARLTSELQRDDIIFGAINNLHVEFGTSEDGQQVLYPNQFSIREVVRDTFNPPADLTIAEMRDRAAEEDASIVVYNNTSIAGLAGQTRDWLTSRGVTISNVGNIDPPTNAPDIIIRDYTGNTWTTRYLAALMGLPQDAIRVATDGLTSADVMIVVGGDVQQLLSGNAEATNTP